MWLKQHRSHRQTNDSDEDDTEQFGIQEGVGDDGEQVPADDEDEEEVLPLYGEADSDFGDSSSEVILGRLPCRTCLCWCHEELPCVDTAACPHSSICLHVAFREH